MATSSGAITRSVLVNLGIFSADNGVRRSVGSFSKNYLTANGGVTVIYQNLLPGDTYTFTPTATAACIVLDTTGPLTVDVNQAAVLTGVNARPVGSYSVVVNQSLLIDDPTTGLVITNKSTTDAVRISLIQG